MTEMLKNQDIIILAREQGEHIKTDEFISNVVSIYRMPDGTGVKIHREWGGGAVGHPWMEEWAEEIPTGQMASIMAAEDARWEFEQATR